MESNYVCVFFPVLFSYPGADVCVWQAKLFPDTRSTRSYPAGSPVLRQSSWWHQGPSCNHLPGALALSPRIQQRLDFVPRTLSIYFKIFLRSHHWADDVVNEALPDVLSGVYYIDPNQGSPADALLAYCNFSAPLKQTCLHPQDSQVMSQREPALETVRVVFFCNIF